ncbi:hypothetical protein V8G54_010830 [Vigna mungo]|uniref:Uncharacterized protein n=1 Tax=Vigna mungo TaxID=3915 RepID=A0AAQ3NY70_VIGMU
MPLGRYYLCFSIDSRSVLLCLPLSQLGSNLSLHPCLCHVNLGLVGSLHLSLLTQIREILMARHVHQLLHVGVVDDKPELVKLQLNLIKHLLFKGFGAFENIFHGHGCCKDTCLSLDDTLD